MPPPEEKRKPEQPSDLEMAQAALASLPTPEQIRQNLAAAAGLAEAGQAGQLFPERQVTDPITGQTRTVTVTDFGERARLAAERTAVTPEFQKRTEAVAAQVEELRKRIQTAIDHSKDDPFAIQAALGKPKKPFTLFLEDEEGQIATEGGLPVVHPRAGHMGLIQLTKGLIGNVGHTPFIQEVFHNLGQIGSSGTSTAAALVSLASGNIEQAEEDIYRAGRAFYGGLPFTENVSPEDLFFGSDLMDRFGIGRGGTVDLGILGTFRSRDVLDLGVDVLTDPIIMSRFRVGAPTALGERALKQEGVMAAGELPGRSLLGLGERKLSITPSDLAEQMRKGERALFSVHIPGKGRVPIRLFGSQKYVDAPIAEVFDMARRGLARSKLGRALNIKPGPQFVEPLEAARAAAKDRTARQLAEAEDFWISVESAAKAAEMDPAEFSKRMLLGQRKLPAGVTVNEVGRAEARRLYRQYRDQGFSVDESIGAARARMLLPNSVDEVTAPFAHRFQDQFVKGFHDEVDAGIILNELTDPAQLYIFRAITPDGLALIKKNKKMGEFREFYKDWYAKADFAKKRAATWEGMTHPEVNDWFRTHVEGWDKDFFHENPQAILAQRAIAGQRAWSSSLAHENMIRRFGKPKSEALREAGWVPAERLLEENRLQAYRPADSKTQGPRAGELIDKEIRTLAEALPDLPTSPGQWEAIREQAIGNLLERGELRTTKFSRPVKGGPSMADMMVPPEVAADLRHLASIANDPNLPNAFWDFYVGTTQMFKEGNTSMFPGFHSRNGGTNEWLVWVGAADRNPIKLTRDAKDALEIMRSMSMGDGSYVVKLPNGKTLTAKELTSMMDNRNALGFGPTSPTELGGIGLERGGRKPLWRRMFPRERFTPELERIGLPSGLPPQRRVAGRQGFGFNVAGTTPAGRVVKRTAQVVKAPLRAAIGVGRAIGSGMEDFAKIQLALNWLREGYNIDQATSKVRKYLFDYSDLSPREKWMRNYIFPFYTFSRKSIPLMIETLISDPARFSELGILQRHLQDPDSPINSWIVPPYAQEGIFGVGDTAKGLMIYSGLGLPIEDLRVLTSTEDARDDLFSRLNPFIKGVAQQTFNRDLYRDIPLDESDIAPGVFRYLPESVKKWMDYRPVVSHGQTIGYRMNPTLRNIWQNAPVFSAFARATSSTESFDVGQEGSPARTGIQPDPMIRFLTGIRVQGPLNEQQQMLMLSVNTMNKVERYLEDQLEVGIAGRSGSRFYLRRDFVEATPEEKRDAEWRNVLRRTKMAAKLHAKLLERMTGLSAQQRAIAGGRGGKRR